MTAERTTISRFVETDLPADDLWDLVADDGAWASWMVDDADIDVRPGATGTVVDDGVERAVRIDDVETSTRVAFTWWPSTHPGDASTVELRVVPRPAGSLLHVTETYPARSGLTASMTTSTSMIGQGAAGATRRWDLRSMLLGLAVRTSVVAARG